MEELKIRIFELEKNKVNSSETISKLEADVKFVEQQWAKSTYEIKENILAQCQVICMDVDFHDVGLDKCVVDGRIKIAPLKEEKGDENPTTPPAEV